MKLAFVFPGQGSQSVGMMNGFATNETVMAVLAKADEALGEPLSQLIQEGPAESLNLTVNTQPAMLAASYAMYEAWLAAGGPEPLVMAGHSLGEYTALTAAGVFPLENAVHLVRFRAQAMQSAVPVGVGAMAAILGLSDLQVEEICARATAEEVVEPVNYNCPGQVVIAGHKQAVENACAASLAAGARRAVVLPVSAPFHSSLLVPAARELAVKLTGMQLARPRIPVIANVDVISHETPESLREALAKQAAAPVQWVRTILKMQEMGITDIVECGPGKVLSGLVRRIAPEIKTHSFVDDEMLKALLTEFAQN